MKKVQPNQKRKPGRPKADPSRTGRDPLMGLRVPPDVRERIEAVAAEKGITLSQAILDVLKRHLPKKS